MTELVVADAGASGSVVPKERNVASPTEAWERLETARVRCRHLGEGVLTLRKHAEIYLPRSPAETPFPDPKNGRLIDPWETRVHMAHLENKLHDATADVVGRVWFRAPRVLEQTPPEVVALLEDVDGRGSSFQQFGAACSVRACYEGADFVLVDFPTVQGQVVTADDNKVAGRRPVWKRYAPNQVIGWKFGTWNSKPRLEQVRLLEPYMIPGKDEWSYTFGVQVRVLRAANLLLPRGDSRRFASTEVWREDEDGKWHPVPTSYRFLRPQVNIPLVEWPTDVAAPFECPPPYLDLVVLNLAVFQKVSYLDAAQRAVGFPILHWGGAPFDKNNAPLPLSPDRFYRSKDPQAHMEFVEVAGTSWAAVEKRIEKMEEAMARIASEVALSQSPGTLTATGEAVRSARATTRLGTWRGNWQDAAARCFYFSAVYSEVVDAEALSGWGGVELNSQFFPKARPENVLEHRKWLRELGVLSKQGAFEEAKNDEALSELREYEVEVDRVSKETPDGLPTSDPLENLENLLRGGGGEVPPPGDGERNGDSDDTEDGEE